MKMKRVLESVDEEDLRLASKRLFAQARLLRDAGTISLEEWDAMLEEAQELDRAANTMREAASA